MASVEQWAEFRRMHWVERPSIRPIHRHTGLRRRTIRTAVAQDEPPRHRPRPRRRPNSTPTATRSPSCFAPSRGITSTRIHELIEEDEYAGGKTILDDYLRELHSVLCAKRTNYMTKSDTTPGSSWIPPMVIECHRERSSA